MNMPSPSLTARGGRGLDCRGDARALSPVPGLLRGSVYPEAPPCGPIGRCSLLRRPSLERTREPDIALCRDDFRDKAGPERACSGMCRGEIERERKDESPGPGR